MSKKKKRKTKGGPPRNHANEATVKARLEAVRQLLLDGAQRWNICRFVSEKEQAGEEPWTMGNARNPLSERQIERYIADAGKQIAEIHKAQAEHAVPLGFARREELYALAKQAEQFGTALAVLQDISNLAGDYPPKKQQIDMSTTGQLVLIEEIVDAPADEPATPTPAVAGGA